MLTKLENDIMRCFAQTGKSSLETMKIINELPGKPALHELEQAIHSLHSLGLVREHQYYRAPTPKYDIFFLTEDGKTHIESLKKSGR